jgi:uncharacterized membrane protein YidH (DUF202 family)
LIVERTLLALATAAAVIAAVGVAVVSAFFALYALVVPHVGPPGAAAIVAAAAAVLAAVIAMIAASRMDGDKRRPHQAAEEIPSGHADPGMVGVIMGLVKERPLMAAGAAVAVGVYALKNPALISAVVKAFIEQRPPGPKPR